MRLIHRDDVFAVECLREESMVPKAAGWIWHGIRCRADCIGCARRVPQGYWFTLNEHRVGELAFLARVFLNVDVEIGDRRVGELVAEGVRGRFAHLGGAPTRPLPDGDWGQRVVARDIMRRLTAASGSTGGDGCGFSRVDMKLGAYLAKLDDFNPAEFWLAQRLARRYHGQVPDALLERLGPDDRAPRSLGGILEAP